MARTHRRGRPSRNRHHYRNLDVIWAERYTYTLSYPLWMDGEDDPRSYEDYVAENIRNHHQDKRNVGLPRYVRQQDVGRQSREHKQLIHQAIRSGDHDVALTRMAENASWAYW